jgi:TonB-dependent receptor
VRSRRDNRNVRRSIYANAQRDFDLRLPLSVKAGIDLSESAGDITITQLGTTYVGPNGLGGTTPATPAGSDDGAGIVIDEFYSKINGPYGFPPTQWVSNNALWDLYQTSPQYFTGNANNDYRFGVSNSKRAEEVISAGYVRGDLFALNRRLRIVGGVRAEQTNVKGLGPLTDPTRNFQRGAAGNVLTDGSGNPLRIATDALGISQLTFIERGSVAKKEYLRVLPRVNASYSLRDNLIVRAAYYDSLGRPNFNQYASGITLPDTEQLPAINNRIVVNNAGIKAWTARSVNLKLDYYFEKVGMVSIGAFRRDFENFFGNTVFVPSAEFLALYALDPNVYGDYEAQTQFNIESTVRMEGLSFNYKQALTFLPKWARGVQVYLNATTQKVKGPAANNFQGYVPRSGNFGFSLAREKYNLKLNWNYIGRQRRGPVSGRSIEAETYTWGARRLLVEATAEYMLTRRFAVFVNLRNLNDPAFDTEVAGPSTPPHARLTNRVKYDALWTLGVKGAF